MCMSFLYLQLALKGLDHFCLWFKGVMQEFHSKRGRNGGTGCLKLMEVTGVSFHMGKVMAVRAKIGVGRGFIPYGAGCVAVCVKRRL